MSVWLLCLISLERLCLLSSSLKKHPFKELRYVIITVAVITVVIISLISFQLSNIGNCLLLHGRISVSPQTLSLILVEAAVGYFLPFLITIIVTAFLVYKAFRKSRSVASVDIATPGQSHLKTVTAMIFGIVLSQLILGSPGILFNFLLLFDVISSASVDMEVYHSLLAFTYVNNGINFYIYILSARGFRHTFLRQCHLIRNKLTNLFS